MIRKKRILQKRFAIFCEGDTEYNYIDKMRKNQGVELVLKPINMHGGGYSNFLKRIKTEAQSNYLAKFIIVDADRILKDAGEMANFLQLLDYCRIQNQKQNTPHFLVVNNPDFEYIACLHNPEYRGQKTDVFIQSSMGAKSIDAFKANKDVYTLLNSGIMSYQIMLDVIRNQDKFVKNVYDIRKKNFEIRVKDTFVDYDQLTRRCSNIEEFFDVIDW